MSIEVIKVIREAEEKAETIKKEASQKAKQIIANANVEASQILEKAHNTARSKSSDVLKAAESEGQILYDGIINNASKECENIFSKAESKMDNAASIILERIVKAGVNS